MRSGQMRAALGPLGTWPQCWSWGCVHGEAHACATVHAPMCPCTPWMCMHASASAFGQHAWVIGRMAICTPSYAIIKDLA
eukprot:360626-Chlamydomonas_euryale.AAC.3